jgi:hypothetical protein
MHNNNIGTILFDNKESFSIKETVFLKSDLLGAGKKDIFEQNSGTNLTFRGYKVFDINETLLQATFRHFSINT